MVSPPKSFVPPSAIKSLTLSKSSGRSAFFKLASSIENILAKFKLLGISLAILSASKSGKSRTRAVSLTDDFAAMVP